MMLIGESIEIKEAIALCTGHEAVSQKEVSLIVITAGNKTHLSSKSYCFM